MSISMATDNRVKGLRSKAGTEFQLHSNFVSMFDGFRDRVFDFTEHRLIKLFNSSIDTELKLRAAVLLDDYRHGKIAISWRGGEPVHVPVALDR